VCGKPHPQLCSEGNALPPLEPNWVQTIPGQTWFTILRLYGPLEAWFNNPERRSVGGIASPTDNVFACPPRVISNRDPWTCLPVDFRYAPLAKGCVCRKLDPVILVMKAAKNGAGCDCADALNCPMDRAILD
jgi:hypothetical protein